VEIPDPVLGSGRDVSKERSSLLKKRSKRLLHRGAYSRRIRHAKVAKVFWFFFSKKNILSFARHHDRQAGHTLDQFEPGPFKRL
jgi:hypothetical protein